MGSAAETVQKWYRLSAEGDVAGLKELAHPDIEFIVADGYPSGGRWVGRDVVFGEFFPKSSVHWKTWAAKVEEVFAAENGCVTVRGRYVGSTKDPEIELDVPFAHLWRVEGDQLVWMQSFTDTAILQGAIAQQVSA